MQRKNKTMAHEGSFLYLTCWLAYSEPLHGAAQKLRKPYPPSCLTLDLPQALPVLPPKYPDRVFPSPAPLLGPKPSSLLAGLLQTPN